MEYDMLKIENQICFPLYVCSKEIIRKYKPFLDEIGLTYTQYITMMVLWDKKEMNVKDIGNILYLDSGTLTPLLKKMEYIGLIKRTRNKDDERNVIVSLTLNGEKLKEKAKNIPYQIGSCLSLSKKESEELYKILYKIIGKFNKN
jgi:DNA-binding MarR family transcriptional regulator